MSSGMNRTQAEEYAKTMTYKQAIGNIWTSKGIKYRKATMIKLHELAEIADKLVLCKDCKHREHCHETIAHTKEHDGFREHWSEPIEWCSWGEREGGEDE